MGERPRVSVLVPVYNAGKYIASTIDSVLAQTWTDYECIVVDDGSSDETPDVLAEFGSAIRVVRQENAGVSAARNRAVAESRGALLAFLDADDLWAPTKLERQVCIADRRPDAGLIYTGYAIVDDELRARCEVLPSAWSTRPRRIISLTAYGIGMGATALLPRAVIDDVGPFDTRLSTAADADYVWRVSTRYPGVGINEALVRYRIHADQMHENLTAFENDMHIILEKARHDGLGARDYERALANLEVHLLCRRLLARRVPDATHHLSQALRIAPLQLAALPANAVWRRLVRDVRGRWPASTVADPSVVS